MMDGWMKKINMEMITIPASTFTHFIHSVQIAQKFGQRENLTFLHCFS